jgi:hypothetical protein
MLSTSISVSDLRKLASDIMPLADFHDTSLMPRITTIHSHTVCTAFGGLANDLEKTRQNKNNYLDSEMKESWQKNVKYTVCTAFSSLAEDLGKKQNRIKIII